MKMNTDRFNLTVDEYLGCYGYYCLVGCFDGSTILYMNIFKYRYYHATLQFYQCEEWESHTLQGRYIHVFWKCFRQILIFLNLLAMSEYSSLLLLLCPDFLTEMVQNADCPDSFLWLLEAPSFIGMISSSFTFTEFVESVSVIYQDLLKNPNTIIVPRSALPNKLDLLIDPEMDQELERLRETDFIAQVAISPTSNNSSSSAVGQKEMSKKASPRKSLHQRKRIEMESNGSTEETDSSEN
uniref:Centriolar satellite-associated tubulin polyglutamylase complex regulator 1 n=1 Tax=Sinocyclocheilus grahami TaxID=75366 RepID=A0A672P3B2_SINGR